MANIFDYLNWRGDLLLKQDNFNNLDALILSRLSYLPFDNIVSDEFAKGISVADAANKLFETENYQKNILWKGDAELLEHTSRSPRFKNMLLSGYVNIIEPDRQMQFSAVIIELDKNKHFISFRGTDNSIVGWQEDLNMYCMFPLPSQKKSAEYISQVMNAYDGTFILGGHSKGGNLAVYAAAVSTPDTQKRIESIFSHDGPGFTEEMIDSRGFQTIKNKIHTYVPQSSIFGMIFEHDEDYTIVKSNQRGFFQHDIYSWEVMQNNLIELNRMTNTSQFFDHTLKQFVASLSIEQRRDFVEGIFSLLKNTENDTFDELMENFVKSSGTILKNIKHMDSKTRKLILSTLLSFIKCAKNNFCDINPLRKENRIAKKQNKSACKNEKVT